MDYSFNAEIAAKYGVNEAVFLHNLYWWVKKNEANEKHFYDGRYWTYNKMEAFAVLFPFWSKDQIRRMIDKLKDKGAILSGNYNEDRRDRTQWYALTEDVLRVYEPQKSHMQVADLPNASDEIATALPDNKHTDSKQDIAPLISPQKPGRKKQTERLDEMVEESVLPSRVKTRLKEWLDYRKHGLTEIGVHKILSICARNVDQYGEEAVCELIDECISNGWKGLIWDRLSKRPPKSAPKRDYLAEILEEELHGT